MSNSYSDIISDQTYKIPAFYFFNAMREVVNTMAGLDIIETKITDEKEDIQSSEITSIMLLTGPANLVLCLGVTKVTASILVAFMTGIQRSEITEKDLYDTVAELANMFSGQVRAQVVRDGCHYVPSSPMLVAGDNHTVILKEKQEYMIRKYKAGSLEIYLKAFFLKNI